MRANARTDLLLKVLGSIRGFIDENHYAPTLSEICKRVGLRSKASIAAHLRALRDLRLLWWRPGHERTFVITDRAFIALEVIKAFLATRGVSGEVQPWHYRLRNLLRRPAINSAIEDLLDARGLSRNDAVALAVAYIKGELDTVRFTKRDRPALVRLPPDYRALHDYWVMTGRLVR